MTLPIDAKDRKEYPIARGFLDYFPDAIAAIAHVSFVGNKQHNPGEELHWAREKSNDHADCIARHLTERGTLDADGLRHAAKLAWRALALLQLEIEAAEACPLQTLIAETIAGLDDSAFQITAGEATATADTISTGNRIVITNPEDQKRIDAAKDGEAVSITDIDSLINDPFPPYYAIGSAYISGPMRGIDLYNFPAFDAARDRARKNGWDVISPADLDRAYGLDPIKDPEGAKAEIDAWTDDDIRKIVKRDMDALMSLRKERGDAIIMLPGWEKSTGALAEFMIARWLGLKVLDARSMKPVRSFAVKWVDMRLIVGDYLRSFTCPALA